MPQDSAARDLMIRPPFAGVVFMVGWILFLCVLMIVGAVNEHNPRALLLVFLWLPFVAPVLLGARSCVMVKGDRLIFRGWLKTRSWVRNEITSFWVAEPSWSPLMSRIEMSTTGDPRVVLWLTNVSWPRRKTQLNSWVAELERWRLAEQ